MIIAFYKQIKPHFSLIDEEQPSVSSPTTRAAYGWKQYHTITEIYDWLDQQLRQHPRELTNYVIGKTHEKRNIRAIKLSHRPERVCDYNECSDAQVDLLIFICFSFRIIQLSSLNQRYTLVNGSQLQRLPTS